jgi:hypothetical protein
MNTKRREIAKGAGYVVTAACVLLIIVLLAGPVAAQGRSPAQLTNAGWLCLSFESLGVHCMPPGAFSSSESVSALVFDTSDPTSADASFVGTALFIRADLYHGQPCLQEGLHLYRPYDFTGDDVPDYYGCRHY